MIHVFCVQTQFTCFVSRHDSRVLYPDMIHLFNCPDNALIMVTQYIMNTSAEADGLIRNTQISSIRHNARVLCPDMIHLFNCSDNELIMVTQYILNTSAETDGLIRSTQISSISS